MKVSEVRKKYLDFFRSKGHIVIPSASLVPENDPTTLFTGSGMQPLIPYLLGEKHPEGTRLVNSQKCFRAEDIEEVGDNRHTTFFEMLGNWSLGDYWKEKQLSWIFEFLTKELGIRKEKLWVTCFEGNKKLGLLRDDETAKIWEKVGMLEERIFFYNAKKNWWSRTGVPENMPIGEPGGPDSEIFYEFAQIEHDKKFGEKCHPNCDCGRFMEIGNSVFMEYKKAKKGFEKLSQRNVDFGGGLERIAATVNNEPDIFKLDIFVPTISQMEKESGKRYSEESLQSAFRIVADHTRAAESLVENGVAPSNIGQGYIVRRLIRRAVLYADRIGVRLPDKFKEEEQKFRETLNSGFQEFEKLAIGNISGKAAFLLFSSYGFPIDMTVDLAREKGITVDKEEFFKEFEKHREISRAGAEKKFKGGLADMSEMSVKYHTATHLLHQALRNILGKEVRQKGSNITHERLRFDFAFSRKMTEEEKKRVEKEINEKIRLGLKVHKIILPFAEAEKTGALHFFGEKYGEQVNVYYIGDSLQTAYSKEFCGGPHVVNTSALGTFKIIKEETIGSGAHRIKATLNNP